MSSKRPTQQTEKLLVLLQDAGVRFVVIGGVAAISHGAATLTRDLDVAAPLTPDNVERLMTRRPVGVDVSAYGRFDRSAGAGRRRGGRAGARGCGG